VGDNTYPNGYRGLVFEPGDEYKGDIARTFFYMVTCYQDFQWKNNASNFLNQNTYPVFKDWAIEMLLQWHREDPVSPKETNRNEAVYKIQKNRNPFIDYPELAEYLWGENIGQTFDFDNPGGDPDAPRVTADNKFLNFESEELQIEDVQQVVIKGVNLTDDLTVSISGNAAFTTTTVSISKEEVMTEDGTAIQVSYIPTTYGVQTATMEISGGGLAKPFIISLQGIVEEFDGVILEAPFTSGFDDFTAVSILGGEVWKNDTKYKNINMSGFVSGSNYKNEDWLISPSFDLLRIMNAKLSYSYTISKGKGNTVSQDYMKANQTIWVTDNFTGDPTTTVWIQLFNTVFPTGKDWDYVDESIILPQSINDKEDVVVAFKYTCDNDDSATWQINNLRITGEKSPLGIENPDYSSDVNIYTTPGYVNILHRGSNDYNLNIEIFNTYGQLIVKDVLNSNEMSISVDKGQILIVKVGNKISKVITR